MAKKKIYTIATTKFKDPFPKDMEEKLESLSQGKQSSFLRKLMILGWGYCKKNGIDVLEDSVELESEEELDDDDIKDFEETFKM